jgi:flagellar protein FliO/FliZ
MSDPLLALLRLAVALPLVLLLCFVVLKYLVPRTLSGFMSARRMRLVEQLPLGPKTGLSLVRVGGRYYLLAYHEGAVTVVREMDELPELLEAEPNPRVLSAGPIGRLFSGSRAGSREGSGR